MAAEDIRLGAHTHNHVCLSRCETEAELMNEVERPQEVMRAQGIEAETFAYPVGKRTDIGRKAVSAVARAGYKMAFTTIPGRVKKGAAHYLPRLPGQVEDVQAFKRLLAQDFWGLARGHFVSR